MADKSLVPNCEIPLRQQILSECEVMMRHAMGNGIPVPGPVAQTVERHLRTLTATSSEAMSECEVGDLVKIHHRLSKLIAPANARALLLLAHEREHGGPLSFLGPIPLIRRVMVAAIVCLIALIGFGCSPDVNAQKGTSDILTSSGLPLLLNELFYLSAAGLGASFATLFRAHRYVVECNYDPKYDTLYWSRFILGIIAGLILVEFVPLETEGHSTPLARPLLAILGGFSATVVYQILSRLVESVGSIVQGDVAAIQQVEEASADMRRQVSESNHRLEVVSQMLNLQSQIQSGMSSQETLKAVQEVAKELTGHGDIADSSRDHSGDRANVSPSAQEEDSSGESS